MQTIELTLQVPQALQEFLMAELAERDFSGFQHEEDALKAFIPAAAWDDTQRAFVEHWLAGQGLLPAFEERLIGHEDWNAQWEQSVRPIAVGPFLIRPTWAATPDEHAEKTLIEIDPKMSFGTGYHESTRLMLRFLAGLVQPGDHVLDAGTGSGILAIAAVKCGADAVVAFDIDPWVAENVAQNLRQNGTEQAVTYRVGGLEVVPETGFDLVLANINRSVLLAYLSGFAGKVKPGGHLVLAGLLQTDRATMLDAAAAAGLTRTDEAVEGTWWSVVFQRS